MWVDLHSKKEHLKTQTHFEKPKLYGLNKATEQN